MQDTAALTATAAKGWEGILDPDESIAWQGRPGTGISVGGADYVMIAFGTVFTAFALFWMIMAAGAGGFFWAFGLLHFSVGAGIVLYPVLGRPYLRRHTWYTLTNRRAFIATDLPVVGKSLKSFPITADTTLTLQDDTPGTIWFASRMRRTKNGTSEQRIGFESIDEARKVYGLMRAIQRGEA